MTKKFSLLFLICILSALSINATVYSGSCGTNVRYSLDTSTGLLSITGTGAMNNYSYSSSAPWNSKQSYVKTVEISNSVTSIGSWAFFGCSGLTSVIIPNSVTSIGSSAFSGCSGLTSVIIPNSVTNIGNSAFLDCSGLTSVHITDIAAWCRISFYNAYSNPLSYAHHLFIDGKEITDLVIPNSVTSIGDFAFYGCSGLTSVIIPNSVTSIGNYAFSRCSGLTSVTIPNSVTSIGEYAFEYCSGLTSITIPNSVTSIGRSAFANCSGLTSVTIPNSVTSIGRSAFANCSGLTQVTLNSNDIVSKSYSSSSTIGSIFGSQVKEYILGDDVTSIGSYAFRGCSGLTSIEIPNSVTSIGDYAFQRCSGLTEVYCNAENIPTTSRNAFENVNFTNATLIVPGSSVAAYKATSPWSGFGSIIAIALRGDANGDGKVDMDDATFVTNIILGTEDATEAADVNKDGEINMPDVMFIINYIKNGKFPDEE